MTNQEAAVEQAWESLASAVREVLPMVESFVSQKQTFARYARSHSKLMVEAEAKLAEQKLNDLCIALLGGKGIMKW